MCIYTHMHFSRTCQKKVMATFPVWEALITLSSFTFSRTCHVSGSIGDRIVRMTGFETRRARVDQCINTRLLGGLASPRFVDQDSWMAWKIFICFSVFSVCFVCFSFGIYACLMLLSVFLMFVFMETRLRKQSS